MPLAGPRLDRPSAIGDDGRARTASLALASLVLAAAVGLTAYRLDLWGSLRVLALGVGLVVPGVALVSRDSPAATAMGHVCFLPGGVVAVAGVAAGAMTGGFAGLLFHVGVGTGVLGLGGAWADVRTDDVAGAVVDGVGGLVVPFVLALVGAVVVGFAWVVWRFGVTTPGAVNLSGLFLVAALAAGAVSVVLDVAPVARLAPRVRRDVVAARVAQYERRALLAAAGLGTVWLVVGVLELLGTTDPVYATPPVRALLAVAASPLLRGAVFAVAVLALAAAALVWLVQAVTAYRGDGSSYLGPVASGLALLVIPAPVLVFLLGQRGMGVQGVGLFLFAAVLVVLVAVVFLVALAAGPGAVSVGLLPDRAGPLALASAGGVVAAAGAGLLEAPGHLVLACTAAAMVAWDVSEFGLGLTVELGHRPETRRLELFHGTVAVAVGAATVAAGSGALAAVRAFGTAEPVLPAMVLAVAGVLALLALVRA